MRIELISALTKNGCIGVDNTLPWGRMREDMRFFKKTTTGKAVIMGRKTYESLGCKPLKDRLNIVISSTLEDEYESVKIVSSFDEALKVAKKAKMTPIVIGGGRLYSETKDVVDVMYLTAIDTITNGDTFFPEIDPHRWERKVVSLGESDKFNDHAFTIWELVRKR